ncbi:SIS domain-containing protein [Jannaschia sp. M317]|uniref:SIS domain-containing protein n=1 Tax=Jannaschia sp. M317 TaxID=2867011 RepID=UPI0021A32139|nr:SIS domain-containing protein [Jannaschia sp. M317]UWQ18401.1 SIS domain-containing protein [Jannaschia sp. M317]
MSILSREIAEIPEAAARLLDRGAPALAEAGARLRAQDPSILATIARGSSDHAATVLAYGAGALSGVVPLSYPPSLASLHHQVPRLSGQVAVAISQSGRSEDLLAAGRAVVAGGGHLIVLTNRFDSPLARAAGDALDIHAGPEHAVAATKSFVNSVLAGAMLLAEWQDDDALRAALVRMPEALSQPRRIDGLDAVLTGGDRLMVLGRSASLGIAGEVALKAMELCGMTALAYSSAEVRHGPMQILRDGYPVLDLTRGAALPDTRTLHPPAPTGLHPLLDPLLDLVPIYVALEQAARARGLNPDVPDRLKKETVTV